MTKCNSDIEEITEWEKIKNKWANNIKKYFDKGMNFQDAIEKARNTQTEHNKAIKLLKQNIAFTRE